jgi:hypothetical protein
MSCAVRYLKNVSGCPGSPPGLVLGSMYDTGDFMSTGNYWDYGGQTLMRIGHPGVPASPRGDLQTRPISRSASRTKWRVISLRQRRAKSVLSTGFASG